MDGPSKPPRPPPLMTITPPTIVSLHLTTVPQRPPTRLRDPPTLLFGKTTSASLNPESTTDSVRTTHYIPDQTKVAPSEQSYTTKHAVKPGTSTTHVVKPRTSTTHVVKPGSSTTHVVISESPTTHVVTPGSPTTHVIMPGSALSSHVTLSDIVTAPQSALSTQGNIPSICVLHRPPPTFVLDHVLVYVHLLHACLTIIS